jgi:hypothetical protein
VSRWIVAAVTVLALLTASAVAALVVAERALEQAQRAQQRQMLHLVDR